MNQALDSLPANRLLQIWEARQKADGRLVTALAVATVFTIARFAMSPGPSSAWVMALFLFALGSSCLRLMNSAAMVARLRATSPGLMPAGIAPSEILDVYEHPLSIQPAAFKTANPLWLAPRTKSAGRYPTQN